MIAADSSMLAYHGAGLERYIQSLFVVASEIYKDNSLGNFVNLVLVKIHIIDNANDGPNITSDAQQSLSNFCKWQHSENDLSDDSPTHYDTAVLLTRVNMCRAEGKCGTLGLAELGTVCKPDRSCAIIEDNGMSAAFTIAHEIGHIFGVPHDDSDVCSKLEIRGDMAVRNSYKEHEYHLMASTLDYNSETWSWSACTRQSITKFLDTDNKVSCLADKSNTAFEFNEDLVPGQVYDKHMQCELVYGDGARICPYMPVCKRLWCTLPANSGCRTQHMPWADGTDCGNGKWCQKGFCKLKTAKSVMIDGEWSSWGSWSECSRTCGGGVKFAERTCSNPSPQSGGKFCLGRRRKNKSCNTSNCPIGQPSFREMQCRSYDGQRFNRLELPSNPQYEPHYAEDEREKCKLYCSVSGIQPNYYKMNNQVEDGTKCIKHGLDICVAGRCEPAGCDNRLGSGLTNDICGVCGGDNSTCRMTTVSEQAYTHEAMTYGYNKVTTLPINASSIEILQTVGQIDENYLAIKDSKGEYLFNGNYIVMMYNLEVELKNGARIEFSGSEQEAETIIINDFIAEPLTVEVLSVGSLQPANVHYKYVLPIEGEVSFQWAINNSWTNCDSECRGKRSQKLLCMREQDNLRVNETHCQDKPKPTVKQEWCNLQCDIRWKVDTIEDCSANCGRGFIKRTVSCVKQSALGTETVEDEKCSSPKPSNIEACTGTCAPTAWRFSAWSPCTAPCGGGTQTREAVCALRNGRQIVDFACNKQQRLISRRCNTEDCASYELGDWSQCSVSCGLGTRTRSVVCLSGEEEVDLSSCGSNPPPTSQPCQHGPCPSWQKSDWTDCSVTCGAGLKYREVVCKQGTNGNELSDEYCPNERRPIEVSNCTMDAACPGWVASNWSECSVTCGENGVKRRTVECRDHRDLVTTVSLCQMNLKPGESTSCSAAEPCIKNVHRVFTSLDRQSKTKYVWRFGGWTMCSATCGQGVRQRYVRCSLVSSSDVIVSDGYCQSQSKPLNEQECKLEACGVWRHGNWSQCSATCGEGTKYRRVGCRLPSGEYGVPADCDIKLMPATENLCNLVECATSLVDIPTTTASISVVRSTSTTAEPIKEHQRRYWRTGPWTECSKSCDGGLRRRAVECYFEYSKSTGCPKNTQPIRREECNTQSCPTWRTGGWTKCSSSCGYSIQERMVVCQLSDGTSGDAELCGEPAPQNKQLCSLQPCGSPQWNFTSWSQCSVSCGAGKMTRDVRCVDSANISLSLNGDICPSFTKPASVEACAQGDCPSWHFSEWSECVGPCDEGIQLRDVWCSVSTNNPLSETECSHLSKPATSMSCEQEKCRFQWHVSDWSECSSKCGKGEQTRERTCRARNGTDVQELNCALWPPPSITKECKNGECPEWKVSPWDQCSVSCGYGQQMRLVECYNKTLHTVVSDNLCDGGEKPAEMTVCQADPCPTWKVYAWGKCSGQCNMSTSVQTRTVRCLSADNQQQVPSSQCDSLTKPPSTRPCKDCSHWEAEDWSECSETCGVGIQARRLLCVSSKGVTRDNDDCSNEPRPRLIRSCQIIPCSQWQTQPWSQCSATCKDGYRNREVNCINSQSLQSLPNTMCDSNTKPAIKEICMVEPECPKWNASQWSQCSVSCGTGVRRRNVTCTGPDELCDISSKPSSVVPCKLVTCHPGFEWKAERWSECSTTCGYGVKSRTVRCYSLKSKKPVPLYFCPTNDKLPTQRRCQEKHCPYTWWADKWSQCSATCGVGRQFRKVLCKSISAEGWYTGNSGFGCEINEKPPAIRSCTMGPCYARYIWQPEPWGQCSTDCGWGNERRKVYCVTLTGERMPRTKCNALLKPERSQKCYEGPCQSKSCSELRRKSAIREDGDYEIFIRGKPTKVYCHRMYSKEPTEYISLPSGSNENYALIYENRLAQPFACPYTSNNVEGTACSNCVPTPFSRAGETRFTKVRLNVTAVSIIVNDFQYSETSGVNKVPYASAGDCYSAVDCPQGRFSVNLADTGFRVASHVQWQLQGAYSYKDIFLRDDGLVVQGKCGGYCGLCAPAEPFGLQLELLNKI
ncbi:A disintegrin and metalloproteinase with thrombospondin motifs 9-like [Watersipora subatra]|uniref:A disintegrin and metalloproteinase with thrombospondin motifs 9-like n=1 Tax=Watersipora subatra TaxID=2589382 RepID=UPI00355C4AEB